MHEKLAACVSSSLSLLLSATRVTPSSMRVFIWVSSIVQVPAAGWGQILAYMAFCEVSQDQSSGTKAAAGDFGFKVLTASDPAAKQKKLAAELANGRLAMMAIIGMFFQAHLKHIVGHVLPR